MDRSEAIFAQWMRDMAAAEGGALLHEEAEWRQRVPDSTDRAALAALGLTAGAAAGLRAGVRHGLRTGRAADGVVRHLPAVTGLGILKTVLLALAAAAVLAAGACAASPTLRETVVAWFSTEASQQSAAEQRKAGDYVIPSPGEEFILTNSAESERLVYRWYTHGRQEVLVQIARQLPADPLDSSPGEAVSFNGVVGLLHESEGRLALSFRDGALSLRVVFFGLDRQALLDYAGLLAQENGIG